MRLSVEILIEKYKNNIYVIAFNLCKNAQDAEDVVQDTFIQYLSKKWFYFGIMIPLINKKYTKYKKIQKNREHFHALLSDRTDAMNYA